MIIYPFSLRKENISVSICSGHDLFSPVASFCKIGQGKGQYNLFAMVCWFLPSSGVSQLYGYAHIPSLLNVPRPHRTPRVITGCSAGLPALRQLPAGSLPYKRRRVCVKATHNSLHPSLPTTAPPGPQVHPLHLRLEYSSFSDGTPSHPRRLGLCMPSSPRSSRTWLPRYSIFLSSKISVTSAQYLPP